ncbi:hypothetical protein BDI4_130068 [Burkholderia diffusa]|nr:hypothetical protein BDI4_130068 [Burkholderia diffusa]
MFVPLVLTPAGGYRTQPAGRARATGGRFDRFSESGGEVGMLMLPGRISRQALRGAPIASIYRSPICAGLGNLPRIRCGFAHSFHASADGRYREFPVASATGGEAGGGAELAHGAARRGRAAS